jgi:hypothetical protein
MTAPACQLLQPGPCFKSTTKIELQIELQVDVPALASASLHHVNPANEFETFLCFSSKGLTLLARCSLVRWNFSSPFRFAHHRFIMMVMILVNSCFSLLQTRLFLPSDSTTSIYATVGIRKSHWLTPSERVLSDDAMLDIVSVPYGTWCEEPPPSQSHDFRGSTALNRRASLCCPY